jgi:Tol biopolymer transport system component
MGRSVASKTTGTAMTRGVSASVVAIALSALLLLLLGSASAAKTSGRGRLVVQVEQDHTGGPWFIVNADGSGLRKVPPYTVVSPNGKRLAFPRASRTGRKVSVSVSSVDGSHVRSLVQFGANNAAYALDWSPDSRRIAFGNAQGIWTVGISGSHRARLIVRKRGGGQVFWSPRGTHIAFIREPDRFTFEHVEFNVVRPNGAVLRRVAIGQGCCAGLSWSPDDRRLVFSYDRDVPGHPKILYLFNLKTRAVRRLGRGIYPSWAPRGGRLVFTNPRRVQGGVWVSHSDGSGRRFLAYGWSPVWSPDGTRIAFATYGGRLVVMRPDGKGQHTIAKLPGTILRLDWSR